MGEVVYLACAASRLWSHAHERYRAYVYVHLKYLWARFFEDDVMHFRNLTHLSRILKGAHVMYIAPEVPPVERLRPWRTFRPNHSAEVPPDGVLRICNSLKYSSSVFLQNPLTCSVLHRLELQPE